MPSLTPRPLKQAQRGLVLVLALIVLAAMSLAAIGLIRGVLGSNRVASNLSYQQSAVQAADVGVQTAIAWLEQKSRETVAMPAPAPPVPGNKLFTDVSKSSIESYNYVATRFDPGPSQSWESFWNTLVTANQVNTLAADSAGNVVSFAIHRLCAKPGAPSAAFCEASSVVKQKCMNCSHTNPPGPSGASQVYYRITVRVQGPRNATSFIQAMLAI